MVTKSVMMVNDCWLAFMLSAASISKFYAPTDSEHRFNKMGIENWLPIGFNLELS